MLEYRTLWFLDGINTQKMKASLHKCYLGTIKEGYKATWKIIVRSTPGNKWKVKRTKGSLSINIKARSHVSHYRTKRIVYGRYSRGRQPHFKRLHPETIREWQNHKIALTCIPHVQYKPGFKFLKIFKILVYGWLILISTSEAYCKHL